jgi:protein arginine kinase activator
MCQNCKTARATVHIMDQFPEKRERHLCEDCAAKEGVIIKAGHETTQEILQQFIKQKAGMKKVEGVACPKCGLTFKAFQSRGLLGCPNDYVAFAEFLDPLIERAHQGATHHIGKVPAQADEVLRRQTGLLRLRRELQEAVEQENYELAARVRDQIQALETS